MSWAQIASGKKMTEEERDAQTIRSLEAEFSRLEHESNALWDTYYKRERELEKESSKAADEERFLYNWCSRLEWDEKCMLKDCEDAETLKTFISGGGDITCLGEETDIEVYNWEG